MAVFEYRLAEEIRDVFNRLGVRYLFIGKSGAIFLGYPDTSQNVEIYADKSLQNGQAIVAGLKELGFELGEEQVGDITRGRDFVQLKNGPFDLDIIFAPDGIENFEEAWVKRVVVEGIPVCHIDQIIGSKEAANRKKDRESLDRLRPFRDYLRTKPR